MGNTQVMLLQQPPREVLNKDPALGTGLRGVSAYSRLLDEVVPVRSESQH